MIISFRVPPTFFTPPSPEPLALGSVGGNKFLMLRAIEVMQRIKKGQMGSRGVPKQTPARQFYSLAVLNVSVAARIRQIEVNLERWRWLPPDLEQRTLLVNLANFSLEVVENGKPLLPRRIVVGKRSWDTWVFSASVTTLILNEDCA